MTWRTHNIDGSKIFLGFDSGAIAKVSLPESASYAREEPEFPQFSGRFAPPQGAELIVAVCWDSLYFDHLGERKGFSGYCDVRHAYFLSRSTTVQWSWLLLMLGYDHDNEYWDWSVAAATDREFEDERTAAKWLLGTFWRWDVERIGKHATPIAEIGAAGLLSIDEVHEMGIRIFPSKD